MRNPSAAEGPPDRVAVLPLASVIRPGAYATCLHTSEVACERFNTVLNRNLLSARCRPGLERRRRPQGAGVAGLLEAVTPLADLVVRTADPAATVTRCGPPPATPQGR